MSVEIKTISNALLFGIIVIYPLPDDGARWIAMIHQRKFVKICVFSLFNVSNPVIAIVPY